MLQNIAEFTKWYENIAKFTKWYGNIWGVALPVKSVYDCFAGDIYV